MEDQAEKPKSSVLKTIGVVLLGILAFALAKGIGSVVGRTTVDRFSSGYSAGANDEALVKGIENAAQQIRKQAPIHVDDVTTLRDAMASGKQIIYIMEVNSEIPAEDISAAKADIEQQNRSRSCSEESTRKLISLGGVMTWQYTLKNDQMFKVSVSSCP